MSQSRISISLSAVLLLFAAAAGCRVSQARSGPPAVEITSIRAETGEDEHVVMTEAELQSHLMSFADRFASLIIQGYEDFDGQSPSFENRRIILGDAVYSMASAFTTAAESDPDVALLDMVVMVTLGHMIYAEHWQNRIGRQVDPMIRAFRKAKEDIWQIAAKLLDPDQQKELHAMIREWRDDHPEELQFSYLNFSDFAAKRRKSTLEKAGTPRGIFQSVEVATRQVEDVKLLAERAMFLATRMPLLTGYYADLSLSQVFANPEVSGTLSDLHTFAEVSGRLADITEQLPAKIAIERQTAINQVMDRLAKERKETIDQFLAEEKRLRGVLTELRETLTAGNNLIVSYSSLAEQLDRGAPSESSEPFNINEYKETAAELTGTITQLQSLVEGVDQLLNSPGIGNLLPKIDKTIDRVGEEGGEVVDLTFLRGIFLVLIWALLYLLVRVAIHFLPRRPGVGQNK